jgi:hypothetical protein
MTEYKISELTQKQIAKFAKKFYLHCPVCTGQVCLLIDENLLVCMCCGPVTESVLLDEAAIENDKTLAALAKERAALRAERAKNEAFDTYMNRVGEDGTRVINLY